MANKMFIDAAHPEETRVVVMRGNRVEEFDFESATRRQLRGNIYLAKVTRVEPSLQAAFVDYGGNRHGFLAFNEIHPDYYQIPMADRQALLEQEAAEEIAAEALEDDANAPRPTRGRRRKKSKKAAAAAETDTSDAADASDAAADSEPGDGPAIAARADDGESVSEAVSETDSNTESDTPAPEAADVDADDVAQEASNVEEVEVVDPESTSDDSRDDEEHDDDDNDDDTDEDGEIESVGSDDALEEVSQRKVRHQRAYKIQEVIKRRQVILVQVVKEERGTKGAALTTYLSLAGRYCVLMPNTARGGGISRKITNPADRRRLKEVAGGLDVPEGMGLIVRTAGANRTKAEVKRDFEYLLRLWENVRDLTLESSAPSLVYEEGSLIKRSIRDLYNKDVDTVLVEGEEAYREAKDFMRMLMPSHAKNVQAYKDPQPVFIRNQVEPQLDALFSSHCGLKSGGYLVINQTEALVAVDVNSGKSTKEHNIEDTALRTNLEAAEEVARQLRLRDLAGLIVIDFIDMEEKRNNRAVERRLKDKLKDDRARIQVGRISHFGLLEMSRQRMRSGMLEGSTLPCENCQGRGFVRSVESASLHILRGIEDHAITGKSDNLLVRAPAEMVLYIFNQKRDHLLSIEQRYDISIYLETDETLVNSEFSIANANDRPARRKAATPVVQIDSAFANSRDSGAEVSDRNTDGDMEADGEEGARPKRRRRRRGRRRGRDSDANAQSESNDLDSAETSDAGEEVAASADVDETSEDSERPKRRRGKRGGRRHRKKTDVQAEAADEDTDGTGAADQDNDTGEQADTVDATEAAETSAEGDKSSDDAAADQTVAGDADKPDAPKRGRRRKSTAQLVAEISGDAAPAEASQSAEDDGAAAASDTSDAETAKPDEAPKKRRPRRRAAKSDAVEAVAEKASEETVAAPADIPSASDEGVESQTVEPVSVEAEAETIPVSSEPPVSAPQEAEPVSLEAEPAAADSKPRAGWWRRRREASD